MEVAPYMGNFEIVEFFHRNGACIGRSVELAAVAGRHDVVRYLSRFRDVFSAAIQAINAQQAIPWVHSTSLARRIDTAVCEAEGLTDRSTLLHLAAKGGNVEAVKVLANLRDMPDANGVLPLDLAAEEGKPLLDPGYLAVVTALASGTPMVDAVRLGLAAGGSASARKL